MRWPWQRSEERRSDAAAPRESPSTAAAPDVPPPVPPAGWAFLPPLQRQVSDAPPAVLRPAFVSTLPTRTVPSSLGSMGHLVDDGAPAGTVAVDGGALGAPVQRAVAADLALRPGRAAASTGARVQRATDAAGPASFERPDVSEESPVEERPVVEEGPVGEGPVGEGPAVAGVAGEDAFVPDGDEAPHGGPVDEPASAAVEAVSATPETNASRPANPPHPSAPAGSPAPLVRPTLQRSTSPTVGSDGAGGATPGRADAAPAAPTPRRVGLGAPLPSHPLQRTASTDGVDAVRRATSGRTPTVAPAGTSAAMPTAASSAAPDAGGAAPPAGDASGSPEPASMQRHVADEPPIEQPPPSAASEPPGAAPLIGETPLATPRDAAPDTAAPGGDSMAGHIGDPPAGRPGDAAPPPGVASPGRPPTPAMPTAAVQRAAMRASGDPSPDDAGPPSDPAPRLDSGSRAGSGSRPDSTPGLGASTDATDHGPAAPATLQRSVALVPARGIVLSLGDPTMGAPVTRHRGGPVVAARVVAPVPPSSPGGGSAPTHASGAMTPSDGRTPSGGRASSPRSDASGAGRAWDGTGRGGSAGVDAWAHETPAVAASVARLSTTEFERVAGGAANDTAPSIGEPGRVLTSARPQAGSVGIDVARATAREPMPVAAAPVPSSAPVAQRSASGEVARVEQTARGVGGPTDLASGSAPVAGGSAERSDIVVQSAPAASSTTTTPAPAPPAAAPENVEQLVRKLYGPLVRRIKAELLLDRERRGIRIDGI